MERVRLWVAGHFDGKYQVQCGDYVIDDEQWLTYNGSRIMCPFSFERCESLGLGYYLTPRAALKAAAKECGYSSRRHLKKAARKLKQSKQFRKLAKQAGVKPLEDDGIPALPLEITPND